MNLESVAARRAATPRVADRPAWGWPPEGRRAWGKPGGTLFTVPIFQENEHISDHSVHPCSRGVKVVGRRWVIGPEGIDAPYPFRKRGEYSMGRGKRHKWTNEQTYRMRSMLGIWGINPFWADDQEG